MDISSAQELLARRLIAQRLAPSAARPEFTDPVDVAQGLLALQGQTYMEGVRSIAVRCAATDADVLTSIEAGLIVRAWPQRGTLHFLAAEDAQWMGRLLYPRVKGGQVGRRPQLGLSEEMVESAHQAMLSELKERDVNNPLPRAEAYALFAAAGVDPKDGRGSHLLRAFGGQGEIVQGPKPAGKHTSPTAETFVHVDNLPHAQRQLSGEQALEELALRYINGHGPVCVADLVWWTALSKTQARTALNLALASGKIVTTQWNNETYYLPEWQDNVTAAEIDASLQIRLNLPAFDEYLLGYAHKELVLPAELRQDILTKNGLSWPWVMEGGVGVESLRRR